MILLKALVAMGILFFVFSFVERVQVMLDNLKAGFPDYWDGLGLNDLSSFASRVMVFRMILFPGLIPDEIRLHLSHELGIVRFFIFGAIFFLILVFFLISIGFYE